MFRGHVRALLHRQRGFIVASWLQSSQQCAAGTVCLHSSTTVTCKTLHGAPRPSCAPDLAHLPCQHRADFIHRLGSCVAQPRQYGTVVALPLAQTGEGIAECELLQWYVQEGDHVDEFQRLCEVQSDKATLEITSRYAGRIVQLRAQPGDMVQVGATLADVEMEGSSAGESEQAGEPGGKLPLDASALQSRSAAEQGRADETGGSRPRVHASPAVRQLAKEHGVELHSLQGTGPDGRIAKGDVMAAAPDLGATPQPPSRGAQHPAEVAERQSAPSSLGYRADMGPRPWEERQQLLQQPARPAAPGDAPPARISLRGFRRAMVKSMSAAAAVPHFHFCDEVEVTALLRARQLLREDPALHGAKLTFLPFLLKALSAALTDYPEVNASLSSDGTELLLHPAHNIGVAMATTSGLVVPSIKNVQHLSVAGVAMELARLQQMAGSGRLSPEDLSGGTITVSNIGSLGGTYASPLIVPPEVAIVALGKVRVVPSFASDGEVVKTSVMAVSWGGDHRVLDGAALAALNSSWRDLIEAPERLLMRLV